MIHLCEENGFMLNQIPAVIISFVYAKIIDLYNTWIYCGGNIFANMDLIYWSVFSSSTRGGDEVNCMRDIVILARCEYYCI